MQNYKDRELTFSNTITNWRDSLLWVLNSTVVIFCAFLAVGLFEDLLIWLSALAIEIPLVYTFDKLVLKQGLFWDDDLSLLQIRILFLIVPISMLLTGFLCVRLFRTFKKKKALHKLFFLWSILFSFSILGGETMLSYLDRGKMKVLLEYFYISSDFLLFFSLLMSAILLIYGTKTLRYFLKMAPSSYLLKKRGPRIAFYLCVVVIPAAIFSLSGLIWYPNNEIVSRFFASQIIWIPIISGLTYSFQNNIQLNKTTAFKNSEISKPQYLYYLMAIALLILVYLFS